MENDIRDIKTILKYLLRYTRKDDFSAAERLLLDRAINNLKINK